MVKQIVLNFDATGFEGFTSCRNYLSFCSQTLKDENGAVLKQHYQAADMSMAPSRWSNKLNETNNTTVTLNDAERYTEKFGDVRWINFLVWKHIVSPKRNLDDLKRLRDELDAQIAAAGKRK
jgi:hypothetical protein